MKAILIHSDLRSVFLDVSDTEFSRFKDEYLSQSFRRSYFLLKDWN